MAGTAVGMSDPDSSVAGRYGRYRVDAEPLNSSGGQSILYTCRDEASHLRVFKRYRTPLTERRDIDTLGEIAARGARITADAESAETVAATAESSVNWPIDIIAESDAVTGVILPLIPPRFLSEHGKPLTLDFLYVAAARPPRAAVRVGVLLRACDILACLDELGLVHGDISMKNLVWDRRSPHAYLIDCDGVHPAAEVRERGVGTAGWRDPRWVAGRIPAHDRYSDRFALAVMVYRALLLNPGAPELVDGDWAPPSGIPDDLPARLRSLFDRAFHDPFATTGRPTAVEWQDALKAVFLTGDGSAFRYPALRAVDRYADRFRPPPVRAKPTVRQRPAPAAASTSATTPSRDPWLTAKLAIAVAMILTVFALANVAISEPSRPSNRPRATETTSEWTPFPGVHVEKTDRGETRIRTDNTPCDPAADNPRELLSGFWLVCQSDGTAPPAWRPSVLLLRATPGTLCDSEAAPMARGPDAQILLCRDGTWQPPR
ncbi:hypothetical protein FOH10_13690 [Nocardia otitidiscaviarum]|uniref:Protein kinase domain-containing protein n=1 Tax=Nocardia otitidiscaviarum TaxID=1823 RepID=A0A516NL12_9NOCA|nr:hypothetical protein [Nocardia otitidiscaviarum]MCP9619117.1 hypothetical protein [Nocardia otitidiscaviarum]QDP79603.1 hypothetical protein FOH10_13690 [Nocardia otitidiscaviarum]